MWKFEPNVIVFAASARCYDNEWNGMIQCFCLCFFWSCIVGIFVYIHCFGLRNILLASHMHMIHMDATTGGVLVVVGGASASAAAD